MTTKTTTTLPRATKAQERAIQKQALQAQKAAFAASRHHALTVCQYHEAVLNFRGLFKRLNTAKQQSIRAVGTDPCAAAQYRILGTETASGVGSLEVLTAPEACRKLLPLGQLVISRLGAMLSLELSALWPDILSLEDSAATAPPKALTAAPAAVATAASDVDAVSSVWARGNATSSSDHSFHQQLPSEPPPHRLVVGMSGGPDSTLALVIACELRQHLNLEVLAVHCIHGLDPDDEIWLEHSRALCAHLQVPLHTPRLNIIYGAGRSPEEVSRAERYKALLAYLSARDCLVLGHQADDQVESLLLALKRGSGPQGLSGMQLLTCDQRGVLLRPLLDLHKVEIEQLLTLLEIPFVYDLSNSYLKFERNFMRRKVLPTLRSRFAGIDKSLLRTQKLCAYEHDLAQRFVTQQLATVEKESAFPPFSCFDFASLDLSDRPYVFMLLRAWLQRMVPQGVEFTLIERCYELMVKDHDKNGYVPLMGSPYVAATFLNRLYLYEPLTAVQKKQLQGRLPVMLSPDALATLESTESLECTECTAGAVTASAIYASQVLWQEHRGGYAYQLLSVPISTAVWSQQREVMLSISDRKQEPADLTAAPQGTQHDDSSQLLRVPTAACFYLTTAQHAACPCLWLNFSYALSRKLKPYTRAHSRDVGKLFIENHIAPWERCGIPLVESAQGEVLALGSVLAQDRRAKAAQQVQAATNEAAQDKDGKAVTSAAEKRSSCYLYLHIKREDGTAKLR